MPVVGVGDLLCADGTTVKPDDYASSGKTAMGVVFYVDTTGVHGWAASLRTPGVYGCVWNNGSARLRFINMSGEVGVKVNNFEGKIIDCSIINDLAGFENYCCKFADGLYGVFNFVILNNGKVITKKVVVKKQPVHLHTLHFRKQVQVGVGVFVVECVFYRQDVFNHTYFGLCYGVVLINLNDCSVVAQGVAEFGEFPIHVTPEKETFNEVRIIVGCCVYVV